MKLGVIRRLRRVQSDSAKGGTQSVRLIRQVREFLNREDRKDR